MPKNVVNVCQTEGYEQSITQAAEVLSQGGLVVFPTETVYGVGSRADLPEARRRLREIKQRSAEKPFTLHIGRRRDVDRYVPDLGSIGQRFVDKGWPGPLTLVFTGVDATRTPVTRELGMETADALYYEGTIGIRCPDDAVASSLLSQTHHPIVAASANREGEKPACTADEAMEALDGKFDLLLDGGRVRYAKPSTIVRLNGSGYSILRNGVYDERTLRRLASVNLLFVCTGNTCRSPMAAALCRKVLADRIGCRIVELEDRGIEVLSAGTAAHADAPAAPEAVEVIARRGLDLSTHVTQPISVELIHRADRIFTMTRGHREAVIRLAPSVTERVTLLIEGEDIQDPLGGGIDDYEECARRLEESLKDRLTEVRL